MKFSAYLVIALALVALMACACQAQVYYPAPQAPYPPPQATCPPPQATCPPPCPPPCPTGGYGVVECPTRHAYIRAGGAWFITDDDTRLEPIVGLGYETAINESATSLLGLSVDWIPVDFDVTVGGVTTSDTVNVFPALVYFKRLAPCGPKYRPYWAIGLGVAWASTDIADEDIISDANFAWELEVGTHISDRYLASLRYIAGENPSELGVVALQIGYIF